MISELKRNQSLETEYLTFYIGDELVAIELKYVESIEFVSEIIPIPRAPHHVSGVTKIENSIIPIISLDDLLKSNPKQKTTNSIAIIISFDNVVFGIYISEPPKVSNYEEKLLKADSKYTGIVPSQWIEGKIKHEDYSFLVLDPSKFWIGLGESEIVGPSSKTDLVDIKSTSITEIKEKKLDKKKEKTKQKKVVDKKKEEPKEKKKENKKKKKKEEKNDSTKEMGTDDL